MQSRRQFIQIVPVAGAALLAGRDVLAARPADAVDPAGAQAAALKYTDKAPDPAKHCSNCQLYQGSGDWAGCALFPGKKVAGPGWCSAWVKKA